MILRINNIKIPLGSNISIIDAASSKLKTSNLKNVHIIKQSTDFRKKNMPFLVYSIKAEADDVSSSALASSDITVLKKMQQRGISYGDTPLTVPPVIAGSGPAGLFCGLTLARHGYRPVILERGEDIDKRSLSIDKFHSDGVLNRESNVQFGEGGAGTFSDGKLTTRINDIHCSEILKSFVRFGAPEEILWRAKPHIGSDILKTVVKNIRLEIIKLGGCVKFSHRLENIKLNDTLCGIIVNGAEWKCNILVLATGHSARDTFEMLAHHNIVMQAKDFAVGVRAEHFQKDIDTAQYGSFAGHPQLCHAEYALTAKSNGRGIYTFCMCPGGSVIASSSEDYGVVTNGMSYFARNGENANSAVVVQVRTSDFGNGALDGINFQRKLEHAAYTIGGSNYAAPISYIGNLTGSGNITNKVTPSYAPGVKESDFREILPDYILSSIKEGLSAFGRKIEGFNRSGAVLTAVESRTSSPVRILRNETGEAIGIRGLYPCGEGAGYAGGIMSAAADGIKTAEKIMSIYKPLK